MSRGLTALLGASCRCWLSEPRQDRGDASWRRADRLWRVRPGGQGGLGGPPTSAGSGGLGGLLEGFSGANPGGFLSSGLHDLVNSFNKTGQGEVAQSWVGRGPNKEIAPPHLEQAIGPDVLASLSERASRMAESFALK